MSLSMSSLLYQSGMSVRFLPGCEGSNTPLNNKEASISLTSRPLQYRCLQIITRLIKLLDEVTNEAKAIFISFFFATLEAFQR